MSTKQILAVAALAAAGFAGCGGNGGGCFGFASAPATVDSLRLVISTRSTTYGPGQTVPLRMSVTNTAAQSAVITLSFPVTESFQVTRGEQPVLPPCPLSGIGQTSTLELAPGQTQSVDSAWDQRMFRVPVPGGEYTAAAVLPVSQLQIGGQAQSIPKAGLASNPIAITLTSPCSQDPLNTVPGQVVVRFAPGTTQAQAAGELAAWGALTDFDTQREEATLDLKPGVCIVDAIAALKSVPGVVSAEANGAGGCLG